MAHIFKNKNITDFNLTKFLFDPVNTGGKIYAIFENPYFEDCNKILLCSLNVVYCDDNDKIITTLGSPITWVIEGAEYTAFMTAILGASISLSLGGGDPITTTVGNSILYSMNLESRVLSLEQLAIDNGFSKE